jgi:uncharacterized membrane protein
MNQEKALGYLFGALTALCWSISPIFIYQGLQGLPSSIWGTVIGVLVASILYLIWFFVSGKENTWAKPDKKYIYWQIMGGITGGLGVLSRNIALDSTRVAIVIALAQCAGLFTLFFGPLLLGKDFKERITPKLILGVIILVSGSILIILGRNL